ncbi:PD40 domain-containing protein [bacterium]|nr:PD40 domain-containing protein [bacterium]
MEIRDFRRLKLGEPQRLTGGLTDHEHPAVSPDGTMLACYSGDYGHISIVLLSIEGRFIRRLSRGDGNNTQPAWHPAGRKIAWRQQDGSSSPWRIVQSDILQELKHLALLEDAVFNYKHPCFDADASRLAYFSDEGTPETYQLWIMDLASGERRKLTDGPAGRNNCHPVFSPDGQRLVYHVYEGTGGAETPVVNLYEIGIESGEIRQLTADEHQDKHPFYIDDEVISFHHRDNESRIRHIELMHLPTGERLKLTDGRHNDKHPFPYRDGKGQLHLAWSSKKLGTELADEEKTYDIFTAMLSVDED